MWLGVVHLPEAEAETEMALLVAYEPHRLFTVGAPVPAAPQLIRLLREAGARGEHVRAPRCGHCGAALEVPPLDEPAGPEVACASA